MNYPCLLMGRAAFHYSIITDIKHYNLQTTVTCNTVLSGVISLQETYEAKRKEFLEDLHHKEEEMRQMFVNRVKETESELKEKEREVGYILMISALGVYGTKCIIGQEPDDLEISA